MPYTRNDWYVAAIENEIADDAPFAVTILSEGIVIWRSAGKLVALEDRCIHRAAALSLGRCEGANLRCMYHGLLFNGEGQVLDIPGQDTIPPKAKVRSYPVVARYGFVWVWMGDAAKADEGRLPQMFEDFENFIPAYGSLDFDAELRLISDNLLDFSHLPFVHAASFGSSTDWAKAPMKVTPLERGVRFERWTENGRGQDFIEMDKALAVDEWLGYDYLLPGVLVMWTGVFPAGTARAMNYGMPDFTLAIDAGQQIQPVTPITDRSSRYFFVLGTHRERSSQIANIEKIVEVIYQAFNEDKRMIEAQQRVIDRAPDRPIMLTVHDRGSVIYSRLKARVIAEENGVEAPDLELTS